MNRQHLLSIFKLMLKVFFLSIFIFITSVLTNAQLSLGTEAGLAQNYLHTDINSLSYTNNAPRNGMIITLPVEYNLYNWLSIKTSITYIQKNHSFVRTGAYSGIYEIFMNAYLQLPLIISLKYGNGKINGFINTGMFTAYWVGARVKGKTPDIFNATDNINSNGQATETFPLVYFNEKHAFDNKRDRLYELGFTLGGGLCYSLSKKNSLQIEINYFRSLTDQQKSYLHNPGARFNQTMAFMLGYICNFRLKHKK